MNQALFLSIPNQALYQSKKQRNRTVGTTSARPTSDAKLQSPLALHSLHSRVLENDLDLLGVLLKNISVSRFNALSYDGCQVGVVFRIMVCVLEDVHELFLGLGHESSHQIRRDFDADLSLLPDEINDEKD